jgi:hypothetical protein
MKKYFLIGSIATLGFVFNSCDKDDEPSSSKTELITRSSWKFRSASAEGVGDVSGNVPACYKDNLHVFVSDGTGSVAESSDVCSPSSAGSFTWSFQSNESQLFVSKVLFPDGSQTFNLVSVTETELKISQLVSPPLSTPLMITFTLGH